MATYTFNGECPSGMKQAFIDTYKPAPAYHADTWYKYANDTEWRTVSITGAINGVNSSTPTTQIPDVKNVITLEIGSDVTSIGDSAFYGCSGLMSVTIPDSVTSIGDSAFWGCTSLTSVTIGNGVTEIWYYAFSGCSGLTSVTIPNSVTSIWEDAFENCTNLTSMTFKGKSLTQVQAMTNYPWGITDTSIITVI